MPLIIVATDFSETAGNALNYACALAGEQNARVEVIHSFIVPVMFSDIPLPGSIITDAQNDAEDQMKKLVENLGISYPGLDVSGKVIYGDTVNVLEEYAEESNTPWLIVVGNNSNDHSTWPDSTLIDAFKKLKFPVLAVPPNATYTPVKKICFAFDNKHTGNENALKQLLSITQKINAELHVVNAQPDVHNQDNNQDIDMDTKRMLNAANPHFHILYDASDINMAIQSFNESNFMDWLILIPRKHSFFEGLFHKSHTRSIAHQSHIPILAIHEEHA